MIRALLKKQWLESVAFLFYGKGGKRRSKGAMFGFALLLLYGLAAVGYLFYGIGDMLCAPFVEQGLDWLYFAFMSTVATAMGVVGGIFTAKAKLYEAKDNDTLFSMPIPAKWVLFVRMTGLYVYTLLFELLVFIPAVACYFTVAGFSLPVLLRCFLATLILPFGALALCLLLGWLLALASAKLPWKNLVTLLVSLAFLAGYIYLYSKLNEYLSYMIAHGGRVAEKMKTLLYPFFQVGQACVGSWSAWGVYTLLFGGAFALVSLLISVTYLKLVTTQKGGRKVKYKGKPRRSGTPFAALLKKELMRYTKNPMIALNCFLGSVFFLLLPFVGLFAGELRELAAFDIHEELALIIAVTLCAVGSMNLISPAAISLEGESLWIARSLPIPTEKLLWAKVAFHALVTGIPAAVASISLCIFFKIPFWYSVATLLSALSFLWLTDLFGLFLGVKMPNMHWTNELAAVKQSAAGVLSMFADWGFLFLLGLGYFAFGRTLFEGGYFLVCIAWMLALSALLVWWMKKRGVKIVENL